MTHRGPIYPFFAAGQERIYHTPIQLRIDRVDTIPGHLIKSNWKYDVEVIEASQLPTDEHPELYRVVFIAQPEDYSFAGLVGMQTTNGHLHRATTHIAGIYYLVAPDGPDMALSDPLPLTSKGYVQGESENGLETAELELLAKRNLYLGRLTSAHAAAGDNSGPDCFEEEHNPPV